MKPKLKMGMVGGGRERTIGVVHQTAAQLDGKIGLVAGAFSSHAERSRQAGEDRGLHSSRVYSDYRTMTAAEAKFFEKLAQLSTTNYFASLLHHGIAGITVGQREHLARFLDKISQLEGFAQIVGHRLVADNIESCLEKGLGHREVQMVRCHDRDEVDSFARWVVTETSLHKLSPQDVVLLFTDGFIIGAECLHSLQRL